MRVKAATPDLAAVYLDFPVLTVPAVWEPFAKQAEAGAARWGVLIAPPEAVAAQPPPAPPPGTSA